MKTGAMAIACLLACALAAKQNLTIPIAKIGVILPADTKYNASITKTAPAIQIGIEKVKAMGIYKNFQVKYEDSNCSNAMAPIAAIKFYMNHEVNVFFGPFCDYAAAPVARYSPYWNIPMITVGAMANDFEHKTEFGLLTRIGPRFGGLSEYVYTILQFHNWNRVYGIYDPNAYGEIFTKFCYLSTSALIRRMKSERVKNDFYLLDAGVLSYERMDLELDEVLREKISTKFAAQNL